METALPWGSWCSMKHARLDQNLTTQKVGQSDDVQDLVCLPSVHLRPLCVLVAPGGGVAGVRDVLQEAPPVLQVLDADVAAQVDDESIESTPTMCMWSHSLGGTQPPCGLPSRPRTTASRVQLQVMASALPRLEHLGATF